ncbi:MAG: hypothetical protein H6706_19960 [Myxococcales bacterium]|nr:hypothetical protein [Myxococcales bacterium]
MNNTPTWARLGIVILASLWFLFELYQQAWLWAGGAALLLAVALADLRDRGEP